MICAQLREIPLSCFLCQFHVPVSAARFEAVVLYRSVSLVIKTKFEGGINLKVDSWHTAE